MRPPTHHTVSDSKRVKPTSSDETGNWLRSHLVTTSSLNAGGDLLVKFDAEFPPLENAVNRQPDKPKHVSGGPGFFAKVGAKGIPSQGKDNLEICPLSALQKQMNLKSCLRLCRSEDEAEVTTPGASSSSEPVERRDPSDLIPVGEHVDTPKSPPKPEIIEETKAEEEMSPDWEGPKGPSSEEIASDGEDFKNALGETLEPEKLECEKCGKRTPRKTLLLQL